jgi:hypothetical protein
MARRDLEDLRAAIVGMGGLTDSEARSIKYAGEDRLHEIFALLDAIDQAEEEWEDEQDVDDVGDVDDEPIDYPGEEPEDYDDGGYDDEGYWEVEATFDYGENT